MLERYDVQLIGADLEAINKAEDRELFRAGDGAHRAAACRSRASPPASPRRARSSSETKLPSIIRPSFTMGGSGGGICEREEDFDRMVEWALDQSPTRQILVEQSVLGWKEYELEVMRDRADNVVVICSIENFDAMGVHTGDSITVAPGPDADRPRVPGDARCRGRDHARDRCRDGRLERAVRRRTPTTVR